MTNSSGPDFGTLFDRRFRIQLAFYLATLCLFLLFRPPQPWIQFTVIGYLVLFWPFYFGLNWWKQKTTEEAEDADG